MGAIRRKLENIGVTGAWLAAAACPICFPKLAALGALFGLGVLAPFEIYFFWGAQVFVLLTVVGQIAAFKQLQKVGLLLLALGSACLFFFSLYVVVAETLSYIALAGIAVAGIWMLIADRRAAACPIKEHKG